MTQNPLGLRFALLAVAGAALSATALGIPTAIIPNSVFHRIIEAGPSNYSFWASTSVVTGGLLATYALPRVVKDRAAEAGLGGGLLAYLAVGCPLCNKAVVALLGASGAVTVFQPIQPFSARPDFSSRVSPSWCRSAASGEAAA
jgi:hypothetical protein